MKTFIKYPGGKTKELSIIQANMPTVINRYFEPFVGGGSVFFGLDIKNSYINDISEDLIMLYNLIKKKDPIFMQKLCKLNETWKNLSEDNWEKTDFAFISNNLNLTNIFKLYKETEQKRRAAKVEHYINNGDKTYSTDLIHITVIKAAFYYTLRYVYNQERHCETPDNVAKTLTYYFTREYCYSSMFRFSVAGNFNVPYGGMSYNNKTLDAKIDLIKSYNLEKVKVYKEDYKIFLKRFNFKETDFIFVDPPYDSEFSDYDGNCFDRHAQVCLADELSKIPARVMVVIKNTDFIYNLYKEKGFNISSFDKKYSVNFKNRNARDVKHLLITNY